jgi:hypothetical protein
MDFFTFLSNFIRDTAWPGFFLLCTYHAWRNRNQLAQLIEKIRYKDFEIIIRQFEEARIVAERVKVEDSDKSITEDKIEEFETQFLSLRPDLAILDIWRDLEDSLSEIVKAKTNQRWITPTRFIEHLGKQGSLTDNDLMLYRKLQDIRNQTVHTKNTQAITPNEVLEYKSLVSLLIQRISGIDSPLQGLIDNHRVVVSDVSSEYISGADVVAVFANKTTVSEKTDEHGVALLSIPNQKDFKLLVAKEGFQGLIIDSDKIMHPMSASLSPNSNGGSIVIHGTGHLPEVEGRLNPILDTSNRTYLYADNIAVNGGKQQPVTFELNAPILLEDSHGKKVKLTIKFIAGRVCLADYHYDS